MSGGKFAMITSGPRTRNVGGAVLEKPEICAGCVLYRNGKGFSLPSGAAAHSVILVGEALGEDEEFAGRPFVGKSGRLLDRLIERTLDLATGLPLRREDFLVDNVLRCRPPDNKLTGAPYEHAALTRCYPHLASTLRERKPRVALALGNQALRRLTGQWGIDKLRGYCLDSNEVHTVIGTYHPAYIARGNWHLARVFQSDLHRALYVAREGRPSATYTYIQHPSVGDFETFIKEYEQAVSNSTGGEEILLSCDIETPYDDEEEKDEDIVAIEDRLSYQILRISFSFRPFHAISVAYTRPYRELALRLLAMPGAKVWWNGLSFDIPRLMADGAEINGDQFDGMHAWQALEPQQRRGLGSVATWYCPDMEPWKLTQKHANKEWYSCADADVALRCFLKIQTGLQKQGRWEMFLKHFVKCYSVLIKMTRRGVNTDVKLRRAAAAGLWWKFRDLKRSLQPEVPPALRVAKVFKKTEEQLKKIGSWREGSMIVVREAATLRPNEQLGEDGWIAKIPKPKPLKKPRATKRSKATSSVDSVEKHSLKSAPAIQD